MTHRHVVRLFSAALIAVLAYGCEDNDTVGPSTGLLQVSPPFAGFLTGETLQLSATMNNEPVAVTWSSSDESIATVSSTGLVTGTGDGRVAITAALVNDPSHLRSASLTVVSPPTLESGETIEWDGVSSGSLARHQGLTYRFIVPEGLSSFTVTFTGGTGDGDIFVQHGTPPDDSGDENPGCHSWNAANDEECTVTNPQAGTWFIFVAVWNPYEDGTLAVTAP